MKNWKDIFRKISLALIVIFILQISLPTVSYAFHGFFMYSADDKKLRGYVYVKDPTKVSVDVTNQGTVTTITYDDNNVKENYFWGSYFPFDKMNNRLKNVNFNDYGYSSETAPSKIVAFDGETTQEFTMETVSNGNVLYYGDQTDLGYYRIVGQQYISAFGANTYIPPDSTLFSFTPANSESNAIKIRLPKANNTAAFEVTQLAATDFNLFDVTTGEYLDILNLNRLSGYEQLAQDSTHYLNNVIVLEPSQILVKDHRYELRLSSKSRGNEIKLPIQGIYSFELEIGFIKGEYSEQSGVFYNYVSQSGVYFNNVQINAPTKLTIDPSLMRVGQEKDLKVFNKLDDGRVEEITNYEMLGLFYSDAGHKAISLDNQTLKIKALYLGTASLLLKYNGIINAFTIHVTANGAIDGGANLYAYTFEDQNPVRGQIDPLLSWFAGTESNYSGYQVSFSDANDVALGATYNIAKNDVPNHKYVVDLTSNQLPAGAVYIDVFPKDLDGHTGTEMWRKQVYDNTANSPVNPTSNAAIPAPVIRDMQFKDQDFTLDNLGGSVLWYDASTLPTPATSYSIYFVDANNSKLKSIAEIPISSFKMVSQGVDLPSYQIEFPMGYAMPSGAQRLGIFGKNAQGEGTKGYYFGFWDKITVTGGNDYFEDIDNRAGHINAALKWMPMVNEANITGYVVQFLGNRLNPIGRPLPEINKGQQQYSMPILDNQIPADAKLIELSAVNADDEYLLLGRYSLSDNILGEAASSVTVDQQLHGISQIIYKDTDGEDGEIGGYFYFFSENPATNSPFSHYEVYFVNDQLQKLKPIMSVPKNFIGTYQSSIPMNTQIPNGATKLAVYGISQVGESLPASVDLYSPPLLASQISITNNKSDTADTITLTGLQANDVVRVYGDATTSNTFLVGTVASNATTISFSVPELGKEAGSLYFSYERLNRLPSLKVQKAYDKEPATGVSGGFGGGPMGTIESFKWDIINQNGKIRITSSIDSDQLKKLADEQAKAGKNEIPIDLKTNAEGYDFQINAGLLEEIGNKVEDAMLVFNTTIGTTRIPFDVLQEAVKANGGKDSMGLRISIDKLPAADQVNLEKTISSNGGESVGKALSYELSLVENNKTVATIDSFSEYVGHVILLPKDFKLNAGEKLNGAVWDPTSKTLISVPLTISLDKDGKPAYATLWRKGNSIYTVYTAQKQFADVQDDDFAKADIESLAASHVIQGFEDGSFRADSSVTRAEFATLLVRGLGIKSVSGTNKGFMDVNPTDWFSQAVDTAVSSSLISGYEDGTFRPTQSITHQEAVTMISNALKFINAATKLDDSERAQYVKRMSELSWQVDAWASDAAAMTLKRNILNANNGFSFEKDAKTTRGQTALLINKLLQNAEWPKN
ncbi:S-layer homology domain-containing protein [Paenibacillus plantarum]|nr:S-layer homology domain-containing protein [Paenibacillus plantarum]